MEIFKFWLLESEDERFSSLFTLYSINFLPFLVLCRVRLYPNATKFSICIHPIQRLTLKDIIEMILKCIRNFLPSSTESEVLLLSRERYSFLFKSSDFDGTLFNLFSEVSEGLFFICFSLWASSFPNS